MARSAAPVPPKTTSNGHGNGHDGAAKATERQARQAKAPASGHAKATSKATGPGTGLTGYHQLLPGEERTWRGISVERRFTRPGVDPYDTVEWEQREAS